jgi:hypothetical protein
MIIRCHVSTAASKMPNLARFFGHVNQVPSWRTGPPKTFIQLGFHPIRVWCWPKFSWDLRSVGPSLSPLSRALSQFQKLISIRLDRHDYVCVWEREIEMSLVLPFCPLRSCRKDPDYGYGADICRIENLRIASGVLEGECHHIKPICSRASRAF